MRLLLDLGFPGLECAFPPTVVIAFLGEEMLPIGEYNAIQVDAFQYGDRRGDVERLYLAVSLLHSHLHLMGIMPSGTSNDKCGTHPNLRSRNRLTWAQVKPQGRPARPSRRARGFR